MKRFFALLLTVAMLLSFAACGKNEEASNQTEPPESTAAPEPTAAEVYTEAAGKVQAMTDARLVIRREKHTAIGGQTFTETQELTLKMNGMGTDTLAADLYGTVAFGQDYTVILSERYQDGMVYGGMSGYQYCAEATAEGFTARYVPAVLLDASLYSTVAFTDDTTLSFSGATGLESWLAGEDRALIGAVGTAVLDESGALVSTTYDVTYSYGSAVVTELVSVQTSAFTDQVPAPKDTSAYTKLDHPDIPMLLERCCGNLLQSRSVSASISEVIVSAGVGGVLTHLTEVDMYGEGLDLKLQAEDSYQMTDLYGNSYWTTLVNEYYADGQYVYTLDGEAETYSLDTAEDAESIRLYWMDFVNVVLTLSGMESVTMTEVPGGYVMDYTPTESVTAAMKEYACTNILSDPDYLDSIASGYSVQQSDCYIGIDGVTGLPTAISMTYSGAHTIDGYDYVLSMQTSQSIDAISLDAYTAVTGQPMPTEEQTESPTPLFYHVTGPDGEEMWLLGTIHVGDQRTTNLPAEIYEAFRTSDALAVEFDVNAYEEQMENDPELIQALAASIFYTDGSTISSHIEDPELYEYAKQVLKFTGDYSANAEMMKPVLWSQSIDNFYLRLGGRLTADYGVDMQLLDMAGDQGKTILDVESGMEQMQMLTGYSDALQEYLLASSLSYTPAQYNADVNELFELWCAGDEAALIEALAPQDTSGMTEEELAFYEEYTKAMEWDRNAEMLEVAKGYLSSGDTVFYAVGLAHLLAQDGLVNTLRAAGYTVELVGYA